jgi:hypothetical protein
MSSIVKVGCAAKDVGFHTTRWSVVISAGELASFKNQEALADPIYAFEGRPDP